jgi:hypothetical protein
MLAKKEAIAVASPLIKLKTTFQHYLLTQFSKL